MDAIQTLIADLRESRYSTAQQHIIVPVDDFVAALNEIEGSIGPVPGPYLPLAGGTMTGSINFGAGVFVAPPGVGFAQAGAHELDFYANGVDLFGFNGGGLFVNSHATGWVLPFSAATAAVPTLVPNQASGNTGIGAQATGNFFRYCWRC